MAELTWKVLIMGGLFLLKDNVEAGSAWMWWWMISATIIAGFLEVGFILGQAYVDKYVRVAALLSSNPNDSKEQNDVNS